MSQGHPGRRIPSLDRLLGQPATQALAQSYSRPRVLEALRDAAASLRKASRLPEDPGAWILAQASRQLEAMHRPSLRRVLNVTGVLLHTNLGRAPLAPSAVRALGEVACAAVNLEVDLETGGRGSRQAHVRDLLTLLTGAPSALVVNNCAAAVMLVVDGLARGREVVVSRGELVEIGDSFRLPEIVVRAGGRLVEVGTTNRTGLADYQGALSPETGLVMVSHASNYTLHGYVHRPAFAEVTDLARQRGVPSFLDLGSGLLIDPRRCGLPLEPTVPEAVAAGFDLVAFSGDKLLGGPQAGILVGRADLLRTLGRSPLARALRVDKLTLSALEATLRLYLDPDQALREVPTLVRLRMDPQVLKARSEALARELAVRLEGRAGVQVVVSPGSVGGGGMPGQDLPGWAIRVRPPSGEEPWAERLRHYRVPVMVTCREGALRLDLRTLPSEDETLLIAALEATAP